MFLPTLGASSSDCPVCQHVEASQGSRSPVLPLLLESAAASVEGSGSRRVQYPSRNPVFAMYQAAHTADSPLASQKAWPAQAVFAPVLVALLAAGHPVQ